MKTTARHDGPTRNDQAGSSSEPATDQRLRRRVPAIIATAVVAALAIAAAVVLFTGDGAAPTPGSDEEPLALSLGEGDALASCLPLDAAILADMSPAFAATATAVDGEAVTLTVDRWYAGGDASTVVLHAPAGMEALIAGFDFEVGQEYLITASDGTVNYCGYSGPATPELQAAFDAAFAG